MNMTTPSHIQHIHFQPGLRPVYLFFVFALLLDQRKKRSNRRAKMLLERKDVRRSQRCSDALFPPFLPKLRSLFLPSSPPSIFYIPRFFLSLTPFLVLNIFLLLYFLSLFRPIFFSWHFLSLYCLDPDLYLSFKFFTILTCSFFFISISISRYLFRFC